MNKRILLSTIVMLTAALIVGCASESSVKEALDKHPEWIFSAIKDHPEQFMMAATEAQQSYQKVAAEKQSQMEEAQWDEEMKNPMKAEIDASSAIRGELSAPVQVVAYSDFQCPFCGKGFSTMEALRAKYGDKMVYVYKNLPLPFHPFAMPAALRFRALMLQGHDIAFKFHDEVYEHQDQLSTGGEKWLDKAARDAGANIARMKKDMKGKTVKAALDADMNEAKHFGFGGTPGYLVNGVAVRGAYPEGEFEKLFDKLLKARNVASPN